MDEASQKLGEYIRQQLQTGQNPDEIATQLQAVGWPQDVIHQAFRVVQSQILPSSMAGSTADANIAAPQANGKRWGRLRTGWTIFKQCVRLLNGNRYLFRYLLMTWIVIIVVEILLTIPFFIGDSLLGDAQSQREATWYGFLFLSYVLIYFLINYFAAGLTANILDIFGGRRQPYATYMAAARSKIGPIFVFSVIEAVIGLILRYVVERVRLIGLIVVWLIGTVWSLGTMFVLPIIMDTNTSAPRAIGQSFRFFKQTWGEGVTAKVTVNTPIALIQVALTFGFGILLYGLVFAGLAGGTVVITAVFWIVFALYILLTISLAIFGSFANSVLNAALYFYAVHQQVPPGFSSEMLNGVFIKRKKWLGKDKAASPTTAS